MQFKFCRIPIPDLGGFTEELNAFLRGHRILSVRRELVNGAGGASWAISVEHLAAASGGSPSASTGKGKIDYREKLSAEDFAVFSALRDVRQKLAERSGRGGKPTGSVSDAIRTRSALRLAEGNLQAPGPF